MQGLRIKGFLLSPPAAAGCIAVLVLALAVEKHADGLLWEMAWVCHIATYCMCLGLALRRSSLVAGALVLWAGLTLPSFVFFLVTGGTATTLSWLAHLLPPLLCLCIVPPPRWSGAAGVLAAGLALVAWACGAAVVTTLQHPVNLALVPMPLANGASVAPISPLGLLCLALYLVALRRLLAWSARKVLATGSAS